MLKDRKTNRQHKETMKINTQNKNKDKEATGWTRGFLFSGSHLLAIERGIKITKRNNSPPSFQSQQTQL